MCPEPSDQEAESILTFYAVLDEVQTQRNKMVFSIKHIGDQLPYCRKKKLIHSCHVLEMIRVEILFQVKGLL